MFVLALLGLLDATACGAPLPQESAPVYFLDISDLNGLDLTVSANAHHAWDAAHLVASLQGIVNRDAPRLFVRFMPQPDDFWFEHLTSDRQWLSGRTIVRVDSLEGLLRTFADRARGVIIYDDCVPATSNLASTIAGIEDRLCLRFDESPDSVYTQVMASGLPFTTDVLRLMNEDGSPLFTGRGTIPGTELPSTGSAKCDAYLWAKARYLDAGRCSKEYMAYYLDAFWLQRPTESSFSNATLTNHDFFIAQRAFFFDLHVWEEESPVDDPNQAPGTDLKTLRTLLRAMYDRAEGRIIHIGGFTPWAWKYTNHGRAGSTHGGVDTEWKYAKEISAYNGIMDADALGISGMANASFYQHYPLRDRYPQNPRPTPDTLRGQGLLDESGHVAPRAYVCFYMGDYDSAAWLNYHVPLWWQDPAHGDTLCTWAFNPNLDRRAPHVMDYVRTHQTANDWFMFGDSGAGYLNPGMLIAPRESGLPDGLDAWVAHNLDYARRYDLSITGFIIDGHAPGMGEEGMDAYMRFSPDGIVGQKIPAQGVHRGVMPYTRMKLDLHGAPEDAGARIALMAGINIPKFLFIRTILQSPSWHRAVMDTACAANPSVTFVDPYTFFLLLKTCESSKDAGDATTAPAKVSFTAPDVRAGLAPIRVEDGPFTVGERNGKPVLLQDAAKPCRYLYFETSDAFAASFQKPNRTAQVSVVLYAEAPGRLGIHYDAREFGAYRAGPEIEISGAGTWQELTFNLPDALFSHGQNGGADFRLVNCGFPLRVHRVTVRALP